MSLYVVTFRASDRLFGRTVLQSEYVTADSEDEAIGVIRGKHQFCRITRTRIVNPKEEQ